MNTHDLVRCCSCQTVHHRRAERCPGCGVPFHRGFLGRSGGERALNVAVLVVILGAAALTGIGALLVAADFLL